MADWVAAVVAGVALIVAICAAIYSKQAADAAKDSAKSAQQVAKAELGRDHRDLAPNPEWVRFDTVQNERTGRTNQFIFLTPPRTYLTHADILHATGSRLPISFSPNNQVEGGTEGRAFIANSPESLPAEVEIRFFPPTEDAPGERWGCPCGVPAIGDHADRGHWIMRVKVDDMLSLGLY
ncbi:hypothetical protein [Actinoplanes sp. NPDC049118]|uniref:hypothetical protein n=1 Tax=Actinoplanes sp. NPDC049118 TaxID=3155769 RepID=UPI003400EC21